MALSSTRQYFSIHSISFYNPVTRKPYTDLLRVIGGLEINQEGEIIELTGGSLAYPWAKERGAITSEATLTLREYPSSIFELLAGKAPTINPAEPAGFVSALTNQLGTSVSDAVGGIDPTLTISTATDVKFEGYLIEAVTATTVNVYAYSNVDFGRGTPAEFVDDSLLITPTPLSIVAATPVTIPGFGIDLTGGTGPIAMTPGDTAFFYARPINFGSREVVIGGISDCFKNFGVIIEAQKQGNGRMVRIDIFECVATGVPITLTEKEFSEFEATLGFNYYSPRNGVMEIREVDADTNC